MYESETTVEMILQHKNVTKTIAPVCIEILKNLSLLQAIVCDFNDTTTKAVASFILQKFLLFDCYFREITISYLCT